MAANMSYLLHKLHFSGLLSLLLTSIYLIKPYKTQLPYFVHLIHSRMTYRRWKKSVRVRQEKVNLKTVSSDSPTLAL